MLNMAHSASYPHQLIKISYGRVVLDVSRLASVNGALAFLVEMDWGNGKPVRKLFS